MNKNILPKTSSPKRYEIKLDIDLENFTYVGMQTVEIEVLEDTKLIYLNSVGHKGIYGHEFLEFEFRPDGRLRYANNSNYKSDVLIRKEGFNI